MIKLEARPEPIAIEPRRTAVLVIDMQNDFGALGGMFDLAGLDISGIAAAAQRIPRVLDTARDAGIPIVYVVMEHAPDLSDVGPFDGPHWIKHLRMRLSHTVAAPDGSPSRVLVAGTWNTEILPDLAPEPGDTIVSKTRYSAFFETELHEVLRGLGATQLLVTGCTTSICVESTVRDAMFRDYSCVVLEDCTAEPIGAELSRSNHEATLLVIERLFGWVSNADAVVEALSRQRALV